MDGTNQSGGGNVIEKITKMGFGPTKKKTKPNNSDSPNFGAEMGKAVLRGVNTGISKSPFPNVLSPFVSGAKSLSKAFAPKKEKEKSAKAKAAEQAKAAKAKAAEQAKIAKNVRKNHEKFKKQQAGMYKQRQAAQERAAKAKIALERKQKQALQEEGKSKLKEIKNSGSKYSMVKPKPITKLVGSIPPTGKQRKSRTFNIPIDTVNKKPSVTKPPLSVEKIKEKLFGR